MNVYQIITDRIIEELEKGVIPWKKPWTGNLPKNYVSKKEYRGINLLLLAHFNFKSNYFLTYKQAKDSGGNVKKGEKGYPIVFWKLYETEEEDEKGEKVVRPFLRYYTVFNIEQCEGIEIPKDTKINNPIKTCESLVKNYKSPPAIKNHSSKAFYRIPEDTVYVPRIGTFNGSSSYYGTLFHELIHSTGVKKRLDRFSDKNHIVIPVPSETYGREELIAELGAAFLCAKAGIDNTQVKKSAGYIDHWLKELKGNNRLIISASSKAQKAVEHIIDS